MSGLTEVSLQQAFQSLAVTSLVASHLVDSVMGSIQVVHLGNLGQIELTGGCAVLAACGYHLSGGCPGSC